MNPRNTLFSLLGALALLGCKSSSSEELTRSRPILTASVGLEHGLVLVEKTFGRAIYINVEDSDVAPRSMTIAKSPVLAVPRSGDHHEALILSTGEAGDQDTEESPAGLAAVNDEGVRAQINLGSNPFNWINQSDDGKYALLTRTDSGGRLLQNASEYAVVDLDHPSDSALIATGTLPARPYDSAFSKGFSIAGKPRRLLSVLVPGAVAILDLEHPDRKPAVIDLGGSSEGTLIPAEAEFESVSDRLYLRAIGSNDLYVVNFAPREASAGENDFELSVNLVAVGASPKDFATFGTNERSDVAVLSASRVFVLRQGEAQPTSTYVSKNWSRLTLVGERGSGTGTHLGFLWSPDDEDAGLIDLDKVGGDESPVIYLRLARPASAVYPMSTGLRVLVNHGGRSLSLVDLESATVAEITSDAALSQGAFDEATERVWVATPYSNRLGYVALADGSASESSVDAPIRFLAPAFSAGKIVAVHDDPLGRVTIVDAGEPSRATSFSVEGFLLAGLLDD